ncbi:unnamed protein product [Caenorhabditis bovis]|uniref:Saccharopine dehydrogenase NADP binding domain-containing protein n=1 Tax=Caenorhabditis bovis TaxID=2654633 RepID=A0A8S1EDZ9_9PELO|nr:unnamed protein product [Caenorhabditis bovis]
MRFDIVIYGVTGFTGTFILERLVKSKEFENISYAVAGRNDEKIKAVLEEITQKTGINVNETPIIHADSSIEESLNNMAKKAKVIINGVGPYSLYGETVVKAAVSNGASHVDISGEQTWIEEMALKYNEDAKKTGSFVVSACGFDSIPADLGVNYLKKHFNGDLNDVEAFIRIYSGPEGYSLNTGTYNTAIMFMGSFFSNRAKNLPARLMPQSIQKNVVKPKMRIPISRVEKEFLSGAVFPFMGCDKPIVKRSQYYDATVRNIRPNNGPSERQMKESSFSYYFSGRGYDDKLPLDQEHRGNPTKTMIVSCKGPDLAYAATAGCVLSAALTLIKDTDNLPKELVELIENTE